MTDGEKVTPGLRGVPETLLWTLYHRAVEARRPDAVLDDPLAIQLVDSIDYPFTERFGGAPARAQWQALRTRRFDDEVRRFLRDCPRATVVALGEGLETQFWRVDNGRVDWLGVDLPEVVELRRRLLPAADRHREVACSVLGEHWLAEVDASRPVLVTAQGLLMYLAPPDAHKVIATCARAFPTGMMLFDGVLRWFSERTMRGAMATEGYTAPPMPWGIDGREIKALRNLHPNIAEIRRLSEPRGRGAVFRYVLPALGLAPGLRNLLPIWIMLARFRPSDQPFPP